MSNFSRLYYYSPVLLFMMLFRSSMDPVLALIKAGPFTAGALLNIIMLILMATVLINERMRLNKIITPWLPLLAIAGVSILYSTQPVGAFKSFLVMLTYVAAFYIPFHFIRSPQHFIETTKLIVYSSIIPLLAVTYELIFPASSTNINGFRLFSTFSHPNIFAFYLVIIVSVCFFSIQSRLFIADRKFRQHCAVIMVIALLCILGTKTRAAWAVIALLVLMWGLFRDKKYLLYLGIATAMALCVPSIQERVLDLFQGNDTDAFLNDYERLNSLAWRKVIWAGAMEQFWEKPILGFGLESFTTFSGEFFLITKEGEGAGAHNTYVQYLFELGITGFLAFVYLLGKIFHLLLKSIPMARENIVAATLFLSYCLIHYSDNIFDYLAFNWYFWFFTGSFLAYVRVVRRLARQPKPAKARYRVYG